MSINRSLFALIVFFSTFSGVFGQGQSNIIEQVRETIGAGSAKELSKFRNQTVDVMIDEQLQSYSKAQAEFVLRDFFRNHPANEFTIIHQGSSKGGQPFAIGLYKSGDETYRVFMKIKATDKQQLVHEIRFSKE
ncbi:MAG: DUF4783 domain-containing protein [Cyclobacteriaceae bacterium]|nr:DUF4783 domain-containing protein [Cyclobacteriaceae bacterium]